MSSTVVRNTTIITPRDGRVDALAAHSMVFAGGRVTELGPAADFEKRVATGEFGEVIDGKSHLVIPGLVNTHHHLYQSLTRCLPAVQNANLFDWLLGLYEHWRNLDAAAINMAAKVSLCELLLHGCTTTSDHHYMLPRHTDACIDAVVSAADELGVRVHVCRGSMTLGQSGGGLPPDDCVETDADVMKDYERVLAEFHDAQPYAMQRIDLAPCSPFNVTRELLRDTVTFARERGVLLHTHLAETVEEEAFCIEKYGCRPVQYMADLGWVGPDVYLAHCVQLNDDEIALFAKTRTGVAHCPASNMRLGSGIALTRRLMDAGVRVGVAVDGSSSNDCGNLLA
ncbi:MAG: amidohydrolase family protein, partial [Phycisphaerae bacterium]|nr:amidohydrolase family protein [Phycisphaerae bacterium]